MRTEIIQPSSRELERLTRVDLAAKSYVEAQTALWRHRQNAPDNDKAVRYWIAERDDLTDQVETSLVELVSAVNR